jgi:hypothetical protein
VELTVQVTNGNRWRAVVNMPEPSVSIKGREFLGYCNKFAGSISQWKFITLKAQYTTVDYSSQLL